MKPDYRTVLINPNYANYGCLSLLLILTVVVAIVGWDWVINGVLIFLAFLIIAPVLGALGFRWWLKANVMEDSCPVCDYTFAGFNDKECRCPNCGEILVARNGHFERFTPEGTIDVNAVDVSVKKINDDPDN
ncbi:hypothetical protein Cyast_1645 [Cyanobacterium stanieri PCC 7202]|uniref:Uncharacterized protein n=1 Tax=Cyanobacterium stanieri (strain ATCC 29140 / PCC 7202) TaxID=292563 RepID=K9YKY6_CYASC|nr:hypothetical protein Cyast_1645 [Cyanobacterium stanieri PCC 7202]